MQTPIQRLRIHTVFNTDPESDLNSEPDANLDANTVGSEG